MWSFVKKCFTRSPCSESVLTVGKYAVICQMVHDITVFKHFAADKKQMAVRETGL